MASINNISSNSAVINVGRTTPVSPGAQTADKSIPVVMASDQTAIPVEEQNKVQSEVALSLLGIPRAEVALGIFADVNTYDVNPSEWSMKPAYHTVGDGIKHLPTEAGALVEASRNKTAVLTSKRFFRYQPGRVSAATFGIKSSVSVAKFAKNPVIRKYGIYDKYDGYYWETRNDGQEDNFSCVRRTQSLQYAPVSPYGLAGVTKRRGEDNLGTIGNADDYTGAETITNTQIDDYRIVGLGADESSEFLGSFVKERKILTEKRFELIDEILDSLPDIPDSQKLNLGYSTSIATGVNFENNDFYGAFAEAYNTSLGVDAVDALEFDAAQIRAKCERDLNYWIDMFLEDLKWGGNAHTKWNTTNFALSDGSNWSAKPVGLFPNIPLFERIIHERLRKQFDDTVSGNYADSAHAAVAVLSDVSTSAKAKLRTLMDDIVLVAFPDDSSSPKVPTTFAPQTSNIDYGSKDSIDTIYEVKKNFWSYYVTTKTAEITGVTAANMTADKKYTIIGGTLETHTVMAAMSDTNFSGASDVYLGKTFKVKTSGATFPNTSTMIVCETIDYVAAGGGTSSNGVSALFNFTGLTNDQIKAVIKNKCQRDVGYVIDGYKNDVNKGIDAETTYNMQMFTRGTGMSVYSQVESDGTLSEPTRHGHLKTILSNDLNAAGLSSDLRAKQDALAARVVANFAREDLKTLSLARNNRPFPGNLVVLRDGLIHTHAAVFDPSLLKDDKNVLAIVENNGVRSDTYGSKVANTFKLTEGIVTFGQHVKITWSGGASSIEIQGGSGETSPDVFVQKGEVLRVRRVLGPRGNEFTLMKADGTTFGNPPQPLPVTIASSDIAGLGSVYINTVVPFMFPVDYDLEAVNSGEASVTSEIATTTATTLNYASDASDTSNLSSDRAKQRQFKTFTAPTNTGAVPNGAMFPYMYAFQQNLLDNTNVQEGDQCLGFINTALDTSQGDSVDRLRSQIDNVNFYPEYVNWIKNNVKPEYWGVYEYRVPRSRFSHDPLNGVSKDATTYSRDNTQGARFRVYSDLATGRTGTARPGQIYSNEEGTDSNQDSLYDFDFTKVTMLKIEFSWYGAVGALFLAYVPVSNGEARWVRVHHLRASNQLKIASLGNATLPITYTTYGGGSVYCLGDGEDLLAEQGYGSKSHHIVKYGASYYIDGGDRGTVRLYSHNNDDTVSARGKRFAVTGAYSVDNGGTANILGESAPVPQLTVTEKYVVGDLAGTVTTIDDDGNDGDVNGNNFTVVAGDIVRVAGNGLTNGDYVVANSPTPTSSAFRLTGLNPGSTVTIDSSHTFQVVKLIDPTFYIGAKVKTDSLLDQNVEVVWAQQGGDKVYLSAPLESSSNISLLPDRAATVYGVETKKVIRSTRESNLVRNRVQVYPTKLSSANIGDDTVRLRFKKTPTFQTDVTPNTGNNGFRINGAYTIDNNNEAITQNGQADYLQNGEELFGWFRGRIVSEAVTVFGRLYRDADSYYFELLQSFEGEIVLNSGGVFLPDLKFQADGREIPFSTTNTKYSEEKEGLSSVEIASNTVVPIAGTGINVATTYLRSGTEQFDLSPYFDYNKEYLSFPLTDIADSLYFAVDSDTASTNTDEISLGVTWEEQ